MEPGGLPGIYGVPDGIFVKIIDPRGGSVPIAPEE